MEDEVKKGFDRREFMRRAAITGAAAAWAAPVIQTVTARPAFASTPVEGDWSDCVGACNGAGPSCPGEATALGPQNPPDAQGCQQICTGLCGGPGGTCCTADALDVSNFCTPGGSDHQACYFGTVCGTLPAGTAQNCCGSTAVCADTNGFSSTCFCT